MENIFIRLDRVSRFPTSTFPALPKARLDWMREEIRVSKVVHLFNYLRKKEGKGTALRFFKDGFGYALAAKTWVPFVEPHRAFVLYACWMQTHLHGGKATLVSLTDSRAQVRLQPHYFELYRRTGHLNRQISLSDYRELFEVIWTDRAHHAGWRIRFAYPDDKSCLLTLNRAKSS